MQRLFYYAGATLRASIPLLPFAFCFLAMMIPELAHAQGGPPAVPHGTCTTDPQFEIPTPPPGQGLISVIIQEMQFILNIVSNALFMEIVSDSGFRRALQALSSMYIAFYGIMFMLGMVQITMFDFSIRMIKIGIIVLLLSPDAWYFFNNIVVKFFNAGTDAWINQISAVVLHQALPNNAPPFFVIDNALSKAVSAKMAVTMMAMFFTPPYGPIIGMMTALGLSTFVRAILTAAWVYLMSLILKALLFGIAPIFLSFILFARTRHLFDGWLNQVVNATLQPVLLFTFLGFFIKLIDVSIDNILMTPVCWTEWAESMRGSPFAMHYWRFALCMGGGGTGCEPYGGSWSFDGPQTAQGPIFPIDILAVLVMVMLADLASRFNSIVILIASDLAGASTNLAQMQGALGDMFNKARPGGGGGRPGAKGGEGGGSLPNDRPVPGVGNRGGGQVGP